MLTPKDLHPYQVDAYKDILKKKTLCNASSCGRGKTIISLTALTIYKRKYPDAVALVVSTAEAVKNVWSKEHLKWSHTKHLKLTALVGTPVKRLKLLKEPADAYVISYHSLEWLLKNSKYTFRFIIADEAECLKGVTSKWRASLTKLSGDAEVKYLMSATPKPREEDDYWGLCKYLDGGKRLGATITEFRANYMDHYSMDNRIIYKIRKSVIPTIEAKIQDLFIAYGDTTDKAVNIPIKTITCYGDLIPASQEKYDRLQKEQVLNSLVPEDGTEPLNSMTLSGKLNQLSSGFLYVNETTRISVETLEQTTSVTKLLKVNKKTKVVRVFDDRMSLFTKLMRGIRQKHGDDKNVCICYTFKYELEQLLRLFPNGTPDSEDNIEDRWNAGKIKYLFLQYSRSSRALNLQGGGHIMVFYSLTFKWGDMYQIIRRVARQGQKAKLVYAYRLYIRNTIDDNKTKALDERFKGHSRFQKLIVRDLLRSSRTSTQPQA